MKTLKFRTNLARLILNGQKTVTWRLFDDKNLTVGDHLELIEWETGKVFATAEIVDIKEKQLGAISEPDFLGHEKFRDMAEMLQHYRDFYGNRVTMETMIKVVEFKLLDDTSRNSYTSQDDRQDDGVQGRSGLVDVPRGDILLKKAKEIIEKVIYITVATVDEMEQPWNSPVYAAHDGAYNFYWVSDRDSQHSRNIRHNPKIFFVLYDSTATEGTGEGVYVQGGAQEVTDEREIAQALLFYYGRENTTSGDVQNYLGEHPRRIYKAVPEKVWMSGEGAMFGEAVHRRIEVPLVNTSRTGA